MTIKFTVHGIEITASTPAEAAELIRELGSNGRQRSLPLPDPVVIPLLHPEDDDHEIEFDSIPHEGEPFDAIQMARAFLMTIARSRASGADADAMMRALNVQHPKGIGSRTARINDVLEKRGFRSPHGEVYTTNRTAHGRVWRAGPALLPALESLMRVGRGSGVPR